MLKIESYKFEDVQRVFDEKMSEGENVDPVFVAEGIMSRAADQKAFLMGLWLVALHWNRSKTVDLENAPMMPLTYAQLVHHRRFKKWFGTSSVRDVISELPESFLRLTKIPGKKKVFIVCNPLEKPDLSFLDDV